MTTYVLEFTGIAIVAITLPLVLELAVLTLAYFRPQGRPSFSSPLPPIHLGVIVPAHNEELMIGRCIESLRHSAAGTETQIVVIAHNCSDRTAHFATEAGARVELLEAPEARGKGYALLYGFELMLSRGMDAVLVVDADSEVSRNLIDVVCGALANGADAVQCRYEMTSTPKRPKTRLAALAFRGFNLIRAGGRDRLGISAGIFGNGFAVRRTVLAEHPYIALSVVEDLEYHIHLVLADRKVKFLQEAIVSSSLPGSAAGQDTQRVRWEGGRAGLARLWLAPLLKHLLRGQLRLLEPVLDLASLPIGYEASLLLFSLWLPMAWSRVYSGFAIAVIFVHVLAAAWAGPDFKGDMRMLARVPGYLLWKLRLIPRLVRGSRNGAAWIPTERQPVQSKTV